VSTTERIIVVCTPAGTLLDWFTASEIIEWNDLPTGTPCTRYPVRHRTLLGWFTRWSARHLVQVVRRFGAVTDAAGGRRGRLDLPGAAYRAHLAAVYRWRLWAVVVRSTPSARTWDWFYAQHRADPRKISVVEARRRFESQPRIVAMLAHNAHPMARVALDPYELDAYQAGEATYTVLHWQHALVGDALITTEGLLLQPASASLADRLRYLRVASHHLHTLPDSAQVLAVTVPA
jgi:hypothetical protein